MKLIYLTYPKKFSYNLASRPYKITCKKSRALERNKNLLPCTCDNAKNFKKQIAHQIAH